MKPNKQVPVDHRKKQLINLPEDQKGWILRVVELAKAAGQETNQTEIIRALVGNAMREDPELFVTKLEKLKLKAKLDEIERKKTALREEEERVTQQLEQKAQLTHAR